MKAFIVAGTLISTVALGGCAEVSQIAGDIGTATGSSIVLTAVAKVQAFAEAACAYEPDAATVSTILVKDNVVSSAVDTVFQDVAKAICGAVTAKSVNLRKGVQYPILRTADGSLVPIKGHFVSAAVAARMRARLAK